MSFVSFTTSRSFALLTILLLLPLTALAQFGASLSGTVQDSTGAVVGSAAVTLTNPGTQQTKSAVTSDQGAYAFTELAPGIYNLNVTASGFKAASVQNVTVVSETAGTSDITLTPGGSSDTVTVNADDRPVLQTADASISTTLNSEAIQRLPSVGGDVYELLRTARGSPEIQPAEDPATPCFCPTAPAPASQTAASSKPRTRSRSPPPVSRSGPMTT